MKALAHDSYTNAAGLRIMDLPAPEPSEGEVLVQVSAAAPNPVDWHFYRGDPAVMRLISGRFTTPRIVGEDFTGTITGVGAGVTGYQIGDHVLGTLPAARKKTGAIAEYVTANTDWIAPLDPAVPATQAGAVGLAGVTALQALRDEGRLRTGGRVLVWGAAGGVGHLAVQIARLLGASHVDAVCSTRSMPLVTGLGVDRVYDYTKNEAPGGTYDVIIDTVCTADTTTLKRLLGPHGTVVTIGALHGSGPFGTLTPIFRRGIAARLRGVRARTLLTKVNSADLRLLAGWLTDGSLRVHVENTHPLAQAPAAMALLETGRTKGKIAIAIQ